MAFDPTNGMCATEAYLRVAVGLDYRDCAPVRGARRGGGMETMNVAVTTQATGQAGGQHPGLGELGSQTQVQSQS